MVTVADLIEYRRRNEKLVERVVAVKLPTDYGEFEAVAYREVLTGKHHVALIKGEVDGAEDVLVRVHSECLTGDVFHSLLCDCGEQLEQAPRSDRRGGLASSSTWGRKAADRAAQQAQGVRAAGVRARHRRGEPRARLSGGRASGGSATRYSPTSA